MKVYRRAREPLYSAIIMTILVVALIVAYCFYEEQPDLKRTISYMISCAFAGAGAGAQMVKFWALNRV